MNTKNIDKVGVNWVNTKTGKKYCSWCALGESKLVEATIIVKIDDEEPIYCCRICVDCEYDEEEDFNLVLETDPFNEKGQTLRERILERINKVSAFWDGKSKGTKSVINKCLERGKNVEVVFA